MNLRKAGLAALAFAAAFAIGRFTTEPAPARTERVVERGPERTIVHQRAAGPSLDLDDVRAVVREELARTATPRVEAVVPSDGGAKLAEARAALDAGMSDGRWSDDDRARLRGPLLQLTPAEADEIFDTLLPALNAGTLQADVMGPPV